MTSFFSFFSKVFKKFSLAFKIKTFEFFSEEENNASPLLDDINGFSLLNSTIRIPSSFASTAAATDHPSSSSSSLESQEPKTPPLLPLIEAQIIQTIAISSLTIFPSGHVRRLMWKRIKSN